MEEKKTYRFGDKLKDVREKKHLTLKSVAKEAGVSESLVSQIEHNRVSPAIDTLLALADALDINLEYLFEEYNRSRPVTIIRGGERRSMREDDVVYEEILRPSKKDGDHSFECYLITIPQGGHTHRGSYGHPGKEMGFIIEGGGKLVYENSEHELFAGDSVSFSATSPHTIENTGSGILRALWIVTPAQRFV